MEKYYIGIDLGGTRIKGGIVDGKGNISVKDNVPTETEKGAEKVMDNIAALVEKLIVKSGVLKSAIVGVGMGVPGMIDGKNGNVIFSNNLGWRNVRISEGIKKRTGFEVEIANDANVAALGEWKFGAGSKFGDCVMITLGTGVGSGIIIDGKIYAGNKSAGAEIGHMVIKHGGEPCTCGRFGCFEAYSSATALIRDTKRAMKEHKDSLMWEIGDIDKVDGKTVFDYKEKDAYARAVFDNYVENLACGLVNVANIFRPEAILLGGGVCAQGENLTKPLQSAIDRDIFAGKEGPSCPVEIAKLGNTAGLLGAAALLMD